MNEVEKAKVLAAAVNYTRKEMDKLRQEFAEITALKESQLEYPTMMEGPQGPQGPSGPQGPKGEPGDAIIVETRGPQGHQGIQGDPGVSVKEAKIINEELILYYDNGETENVGKVTGPRGGQGLKGDQGVQGEIGPIGEQGPIGPEGPTGPRGFLGEQGEPGPTGPMGPMGATGPKGDKGDQGVKGDTGERGIQGPIGPTGVAGEKGQRGEQGPVGLQGPPGRDGTEVDTTKIKKDLEVDLEEFKTKISGQVTRLAVSKGGGSSAGSGEVRFEFLDDINRDSVKVDGKFVKYDSGTGKFIGADAGSDITNLSANTISIVNPASHHIYTVKVIDKTSAHPYTGVGSNYGYSLNDKESPTLILVPNMTYRFDQSDSSNSTHPLRFYTDAAKSSGYTTGVTTNGTAGSTGAYTQISVTANTPGTLFYQCSSHGYMGSAIGVTSAGATQTDITNAVNDLVDAAPEQLNTLNELAAALNDDANFSTTVVNLINDRMQVANVTTLTSTSAIQTKAALANTNSAIADRMQVANTTTLVNDRMQVANTTLLVNDRLQVANATLQNITATGATTDQAISITSTGTDAMLSLTTTDAGSGAGPVLDLHRDSSSPANADYLGQIKFQGESSAGTKRIYAKVTGKIGSVTNGSEDGLIEYAVRSGGSNKIISRFKKNEIQSLNGTHFTENGNRLVSNTYAQNAFVQPGASNITFSGDSVTITGNLVVQGTTTQTTSSSANVVNQFMILNSGLGAGVSPSQNAGIRVNRGSAANVELRFNESSDKFEFTNNGTAFNVIPTPDDIALANTNSAITTVNNNIEETSLALAIALG